MKTDQEFFTKNVMSTENAANAELITSTESVSNAIDVVNAEIVANSAETPNVENVSNTEIATAASISNAEDVANNEITVNVASDVCEDNVAVAEIGKVNSIHSENNSLGDNSVNLQSTQTSDASPTPKFGFIRKLWTPFKQNVVYYWGKFANFCSNNVKSLLGQMACGTMFGLIIALFISLCYCPMIYYAYNSFLNYDAYLKPVDDASLSETFVKGSSTNNYIIAFSEKDAQVDLNEKSIDASNPDAPIINKEFVYTVKSLDAKGVQKELFSVIISDKTETNMYLEKRALALSVCKLLPTKEVKQPAQEVENSEEQSGQELEKTDEQAIEQTIAYELVPWNEFANIAPSNSIFVLTSFMDVLKYPSYPTSISAFASWLKEYGNKSLELNKANISNDDVAIISSALERIMDKQWRYQKKGDLSLLFSRCINGSIQFICFVLFTTTLILLLSRYIVVQLCDPLCRLPESQRELIKTDKEACKEQIDCFKDKYGLEPPTLVLWNETFNNQDRNVNDCLAQTDDRIRKSRETSLDYVSFMIESIPALGFIGTIIGIGMTMMNVCSVIASDIARQQSRITDLSLDLAFAFDTTLLGLLLSLIIGFFIRALEHGEQSSINNNSNLIRGLREG